MAVMAGCDELVVVLGAGAEQVAKVLPPSKAGLSVVINPDHLSGMGSSLAVGLSATVQGTCDAALVMLVDLPDVTPAVLVRLAATTDGSEQPTSVLARAAYAGRPGHPVLIGRDHFSGVIAGAVGDAGARGYLQAHPVRLVECGDLGGGRDVDTPDQV